MRNKYAGFTVRFVASLLDSMILTLPHLLFLGYIASSPSIPQLVYRIALYIIAIWLPLAILGIFYAPILTHYFGGTLGKLLTGLRVSDEQFRLLSFKRSFFRHTVGYWFSSLIFGLGFFSIIKDPQKKGWHDKAAGSQVVIQQLLWPVGVVLLLMLLGCNIFLVTKAATIVMNNRPLIQEFTVLFTSINPSKTVPTPLPPVPPTNNNPSIKEL